MRFVRVDAAARAELTEAASYYEARQAGRGDDLLRSFQSAVESIVRMPAASPMTDHPYRAYVMSRFRYTLMYDFSDSEIYIIAFKHQSRDPDYWKDRIKDIPK